MKTKVCKMCKVEKELLNFGVRKQSKDGLDYYCKECKSVLSKNYYNNMDTRQKALKVFQYINKRCTNKKYQEDRPKYENIENKLDKDKFIEWYEDNYFDGCEVDRIDDTKDYSMDNIQLLSKEDHNHKRKCERDGYIPIGYRKCNKCKTIKIEDNENFSTHKGLVSKFNPQGYRGECKECSNKKRKQYYKDKGK